MRCKMCEDWRKEAKRWEMENNRNKEVARELSMELERLRNLMGWALHQEKETQTMPAPKG